LHSHTEATDGRNTLEEMVTSAQTLGFEYLAITEHSRRQAMAHGFDPDRLLRQVDAIDQLNRSLEGIRVLKGSRSTFWRTGTSTCPIPCLPSSTWSSQQSTASST
jgi:DNA polymerase (family X)